MVTASSTPGLTDVARNTETMPSYVDLDLRWGHDFAITPNKSDDAPRLGFSAGAFNVLNHQNPASIDQVVHLIRLRRSHRGQSCRAASNWACASSSDPTACSLAPRSARPGLTLSRHVSGPGNLSRVPPLRTQSRRGDSHESRTVGFMNVCLFVAAPWLLPLRSRLAPPRRCPVRQHHPRAARYIRSTTRCASFAASTPRAPSRDDIVVFFGDVHIATTANHDVVNFFGSISADDNAHIGNDMVSMFGSIRLGEDVSIGKDLVAMFGGTARRRIGHRRRRSRSSAGLDPLGTTAGVLLVIIVVVREFAIIAAGLICVTPSAASVAPYPRSAARHRGLPQPRRQNPVR